MTNYQAYLFSYSIVGSGKPLPHHMEFPASTVELEYSIAIGVRDGLRAHRNPELSLPMSYERFKTDIPSQIGD